MKKVFSIFLLIAFVLNSVGFLVVFKLSQGNIRSEIKESIKNQDFNKSGFIILALNSNDYKNINWDGEDEFIFKGTRYDLIEKKENVNGTVVLYCIDDKKESSLFNGLDTFIKNHFDSGSPNKSEKGFMKLLLKEYSDNFYKAINLTVISNTIIFKDLKQTFPTFISELATPPPRQLA